MASKKKPTQKKEALPRGRPTKYTDDMPEKLLSMTKKATGKRAFTMNTFASYLKISRATLYEWQQLYPDFLDAVNVHRAMVAAEWNDMHYSNAQTGNGGAGSIALGLNNMDIDYKVDRVQKVDHSSTDGTMSPTSIEVRFCTKEEMIEAENDRED